MKFIVVSDVRCGDAVLEMFECIGLDAYRGVIEKHVTVGADAKQVLAGVSAVMWAPKWPDMMRLTVGTTANRELCAAKLASVVVKKFELAADGGVTNDARDALKNAVRSGRRVDVVGGLRIAPDITGNLAYATTAANVLVDSQEGAITESAFGRE